MLPVYLRFCHGMRGVPTLACRPLLELPTANPLSCDSTNDKTTKTNIFSLTITVCPSFGNNNKHKVSHLFLLNICQDI